MIAKWTRFDWILMAALLLCPASAAAERTVHWQINPQGFPTNVFVYTDVEENGQFRADLPPTAFQVGIDEFVGEQGGWLLDANGARAGLTGAQILLMVDRSRSYTGAFDEAQALMRQIVGQMDPARDQVGLGILPTDGGFEEAKQLVPFTGDKTLLTRTIDGLKLATDDKNGARICNGLAEGLKWFPEGQGERYRVVVLFTGGADKGEGKGDCVESSIRRGVVPYFPIVLPLDRKYDDPRARQKIENQTFDLARKTGGQSIFRRSEAENASFVKLLWNRIRSQYRLQVTFPCFRPAPTVDHMAVLKVEGRDSDGIPFRAVSAPASVPQLNALYPPSATRKQVDDGQVKLTIDGTGFCGRAGTIRVSIGGVPLSNVEIQNPFRLVVTPGSAVESGKVTVVNQFGSQGESAVKFEVVATPKGAEASSTMTVLVIVLVALAFLSVLVVALRSRKAKVPPRGAAEAPRPAAVPGGSAPSRVDAVPAQAVAKTMAISGIVRAWVELDGDVIIELNDGPNIIGRVPTARIQLDVPGVSREHARLDVERNLGLIWAEDLGSTNGTYVGPTDGSPETLKKIERRQIVESGQMLVIGGQKIRLRTIGGQAGQAGREG